jgi:CubicO group peptidase (beta-lactamase class C family)
MAGPALPAAAVTGINTAAATFSSATGVKNFSLAMMRGEQVLYRKDFGDYRPHTVIPLASATKWITGATVMTLVDKGKISLDAPVKTWLPDLPAAYADLTLRQLMSFTSGLASLQDGAVDVRQDKTISMDQAVRELAKLPLKSKPGTDFAYGGPNLQFAGAVVEKVSGQAWGTYFRTELGDPLGMKPFFWSNPSGPNKPESVHNPILQGGAATTLDAYLNFLTMVADRGVFKGRRYLSEAAIDSMERVATHGLAMRYVPAGAGPGANYAVAHWCEASGLVAGKSGCTMLASPGAFGVYPWIDRAHGLHGVIFVQDQLARIADAERVLREVMIHAASDAH